MECSADRTEYEKLKQLSNYGELVALGVRAGPNNFTYWVMYHVFVNRLGASTTAEQAVVARNCPSHKTPDVK